MRNGGLLEALLGERRVCNLPKDLKNLGGMGTTFIVFNQALMGC